MIIQGFFIDEAPYFSVRLRAPRVEGTVRLLADTGASRTILMDGDARRLNLRTEEMTPSSSPIIGIGGSVPSYLIQDVEFQFAASQGDFIHRHNLWVVRHNMNILSSEEASRILRLPSLLGRDILNRFRFLVDYRKQLVTLERD